MLTRGRELQFRSSHGLFRSGLLKERNACEGAEDSVGKEGTAGTSYELALIGLEDNKRADLNRWNCCMTVQSL